MLRPSIVSVCAGTALLAALAAPARAVCAGDCDGDGTVSIAELVTLVGVALDGSGTTRCPAGDRDADGTITIDELIAAVSSALLGCPATPTLTPTAMVADTGTPTASLTPAATASASATPSSSAPPSATATGTRAATATGTGSAVLTASPTGSASPTSSATESASPTSIASATRTASTTASAAATSTPTSAASATASPSPNATATASASRPPSATATRSRTPSVTPTAPASASATRSPSATRTPSVTRTPTRTATSPPTATATRTATPTRSATTTRTATPSLTPTRTATATPGLGVRRFSLDPATSHLALLPDLGTFSGFSGFLDLAAGVPDPVSGLARVDIVGASDFLSVQVGTLTVCIKPLVPVSNAGVLACNGGVDLGVSASQDHNIGKVGVNGFSAQDCAAAGGTVEAPSDPHPGVCNGPVEVGASPEADSGIGALLIAPDARFGTQGLPAEVTIDTGACDTHGAGEPSLFGFVSGVSRATIADANNVTGAIFQHDEHGENFSCPQWMQENGPGRLVLSVPSLHGSMSDDLITVFVLDD